MYIKYNVIACDETFDTYTWRSSYRPHDGKDGEKKKQKKQKCIIVNLYVMGLGGRAVNL